MSVAPNALGFITVPIPGTAVRLTAVSTPSKSIRMEPRRNATTVNVGNVYIGGSTLSKNTPGTIYGILSPEQVEGTTIFSAPGQNVDLADWFVDADNAGDGVLVGFLT